MKPKTQEVILSSDHLDSHNTIITKTALEGMREIMNGPRKVKITVEHQRDVPPLGKILNGRLVEHEGHNYLVAKQVYYDVYEPVSWNDNLLKASSSIDDHPFNEPDFEPPKGLELEIDRENFDDHKKYEDYLKVVKEDEPSLVTREFGRKSIINDPEIVLRLAEYYIIYKILKPTFDKTAKKISEKVSDKISKDTEKLYDFIRNSFVEYCKRVITGKKPVSYIIKVPGTPEIELFARIKSAEELISVLKTENLESIKSEIDSIQENVEFEKIQFILENNEWKFNFLLTSSGEAIGTKKSFKKRDRLLELIDKKGKNENKEA